MNIPVFPLPVFLLPEGVVQLKIIEQRYLKMVKVAATQNGFAIVLNDLVGQNQMTASWVEITNFDTNAQGMLVIKVKCKGLVSLTSSYIDDSNLLWANLAPVAHWPEQSHQTITKHFSQLLHSFFNQNESLFALYNNEFIDTPNWVIARWLELLPIEAEQKCCFFKQNSKTQAQQFLSKLLLNENI